MIGTLANLRERLERGYGMRAQRLVEGGLIAASFLFDDVRPAQVAFGLLLAQAVLTPIASPIALGWLLVERRLPVNRLGNLYFDVSGSRGAAAISCIVMLIAYALGRAGLPTIGRALLGFPCASCILSATVGFCAGCGYYVLGRDLLARVGLVRRTPGGATDVDLERG